MRVKIQITFSLLLTIAAVSGLTAPAHAQSDLTTTKRMRPELALGYTYERSNAPPGSCTCFTLNGGNATFAWPLKTGRLSLVGDITADHASNISSAGYSLTLSTFNAGARYTPRIGHSSLHPFSQALIGLAHSSGTLVQAGTAAAGNSSVAFAANLGGGIDYSVSRRFSIRLFEADYLLTTFDNGSNNHQNNLRMSAGVVFHF